MCRNTIIRFPCGHYDPNPFEAHWTQYCFKPTPSKTHRLSLHACPDSSTLNHHWLTALEPRCSLCRASDPLVATYRTAYALTYARSVARARHLLRCAARSEHALFKHGDEAAKARFHAKNYLVDVAQDSRNSAEARRARIAVDSAVRKCFKRVLGRRGRAGQWVRKGWSRAPRVPGWKALPSASRRGMRSGDGRGGKGCGWRVLVARKREGRKMRGLESESRLKAEQRARNRCVEETWASDVGLGPLDEDPRDWLMGEGYLGSVQLLTKMEDLLPGSLRVAPEMEEESVAV